MTKTIQKFETKYGYVLLAQNKVTHLYEIEYSDEVETVFNTKKSIKEAKDLYNEFVKELKTLER